MVVYFGYEKYAAVSVSRGEVVPVVIFSVSDPYIQRFVRPDTIDASDIYRVYLVRVLVEHLVRIVEFDCKINRDGIITVVYEDESLKRRIRLTERIQTARYHPGPNESSEPGELPSVHEMSSFFEHKCLPM